MAFRKTIGFIGGGNMAEALTGGILQAGLVAPEMIIVSELLEERRDHLAETYGVKVTSDNGLPAKESGTLFLAVKPQILPGILEEIGPIQGLTSWLSPSRRGSPSLSWRRGWPGPPS